jgi:hypothetical protein
MDPVWLDVGASVTVAACVVLPWIALRRCVGCGALALRTARPAHRCPSPAYSRLAMWWTAVVVPWVTLGLVWILAGGA